MATSYGYDSIYELTGVTQGSTTTESYAYDPVGNRTASLGVSSYSANSSNELTAMTGATFTYDNNGNTTSKTVSSNTTNYSWDFENRLTTVTLPGTSGTVSFKYDPFGRRIYKSSSSGTSIFAYDGDNLVEETSSSGTAIARYSQGLNIDEPLSMLRSSTTSYYNADGLGTVTSLANASGALAQTYIFDSFGKQTASSGSLTNPFQYTARESDSETGLYYYRARYYDLIAGRFLSEDPVGFRGRDINLYRYVRNQPGRLTDPIGLVTIDPTFNPSCLSALKRAIKIVRNLPKKCDCAFKNIGSHRSLKNLIDDPGIAIHFDPGPPDPEINEDAYTLPGDTHNIWIHPRPCRLGRWALASLLVHELTHITLVPPNDRSQDAPNGPAYGMQRACGLFPLPETSVHEQGPPAIELESAPPDKWVDE